MRIVVGLGNPGFLYRNTRHNAGFIFVEEIAKFHKAKWQINKSMKLQMCEVIVEGEKVLLVKPLTYMNLSGDAVNSIVKFYKLPIENLLIVYDELDFNVGSLRIKPSGSSGGHKGMSSIIDRLQTEDIKRIRIGIFSEGKEYDTNRDYVLGRFSKAEKIKLEDIKYLANILISDYVVLSFEDLMTKYNKKKGS